MPKQRFDGVIEAVRYSPQGQIAFVRAYERRGAAFSDCILLDRAALIERLKARKRFVTGQRLEFLAGTFDPAHEVLLLSRNGKEIISTKPDAERDYLEGALAI